MIICVFVGFSRIVLLGILIFKGLTARRLYKSLGVKELIYSTFYTGKPFSKNPKCLCSGAKLLTFHVVAVTLLLSPIRILEIRMY
jgi:hypothetical protein